MDWPNLLEAQCQCWNQDNTLEVCERHRSLGGGTGLERLAAIEFLKLYESDIFHETLIKSVSFLIYFIVRA